MGHPLLARAGRHVFFIAPGKTIYAAQRLSVCRPSRIPAKPRGPTLTRNGAITVRAAAGDRQTQYKQGGSHDQAIGFAAISSIALADDLSSATAPLPPRP